MSLIDVIKNEKWEIRSRTDIEMQRYTIKLAKISTPLLSRMLTEYMRTELIGPKAHAQDKLAERLFVHYLDEDGSDFMLTLEDMKYMNSAVKLHDMVTPAIDLRVKDTRTKLPNPAWGAACTQAEATGIPQNYAGRLLSHIDNGAISAYTVKYSGQVKQTRQFRRSWEPKATGNVACAWEGAVEYYDRFDLDPRWDWSPSNREGRSPGGERRTRIGYILDVGTDFDMISPKANVFQREFDSAITFSS
jgi:hypothetical protein